MLHSFIPPEAFAFLSKIGLVAVESASAALLQTLLALDAAARPELFRCMRAAAGLMVHGDERNIALLRQLSTSTAALTGANCILRSHEEAMRIQDRTCHIEAGVRTSFRYGMGSTENLAMDLERLSQSSPEEIESIRIPLEFQLAEQPFVFKDGCEAWLFLEISDWRLSLFTHVHLNMYESDQHGDAPMPASFQFHAMDHMIGLDPDSESKAERLYVDMEHANEGLFSGTWYYVEEEDAIPPGFGALLLDLVLGHEITCVLTHRGTLDKEGYVSARDLTGCLSNVSQGTARGTSLTKALRKVFTRDSWV